jgi:hypothetical protein
LCAQHPFTSAEHVRIQEAQPAARRLRLNNPFGFIQVALS